MRTNLPVTQKERLFDTEQRIISTTNLEGRITSINQAFIDISGYEEQELLGQPHNIVRHPDMPPEAYKDMWHCLKQKQAWMGLVKNRCKNGDHYWVNAYVTPIYNGKEVVGYQSVRTRPARRYVESADRLYRSLANSGAPYGFKLPLTTLEVVGVSTLILAVAAIPSLQASPLGWIIAVATALGLSAGLRQWLRRPLRQLRANNSAMKEVRRLACLAYCGRADEASGIEVAIQALRSQQATLVQLIQHSAGVLEQQMDSLNQSSEQNVHNVSLQTNELGLLASSVTQMSASIQEVAGNAQRCADSARQANNEVDQGNQLVATAVGAVESLADEVKAAVNLIQQLQHDAEQISSIIGVINSIAEQTNLLALNAAIEAARAGESGRGFAVVADEVRSLASRTQSSTMEIEAMITALQKRVNDVVATMDSSQSYADTTRQSAQHVDTALSQIAGLIQTLSDMSVQIAAATEQQSNVTEEISRNLTQINDSAGSISSSVQASSAAGKELAEVMQELKSTVIYFQQRH
ncbi:PAS domain S-box protein [Motiliproteus coralliicola]|uniref:PAS domain S-box protein n=1 Tax=Motiliproteus coralliicola TaxID=2283196 RepID=A0A369WAZ5_9GAMM|nr:PAS domain-containing methyl-accepting chemotaxis protein [Motiliproteus coralliicola]RDE18473.1 PAS domain S-box protein [Motiliproteus coralliicola]